MKATELMVGNFIKTIYAQKIIKVREIKQSCIYTNDNGYEYNEIEPIPLTPEILEKNGFRIMFEGELHKTYFQDIESFHIEVKIDCINYIKLSMSNGLGYMVTIECKYIHQLQHALRLCGISKEIEL